MTTCNKEFKGVRKFYRKVSGDDGVVICVKSNGKYVWIFRDGKCWSGRGVGIILGSINLDFFLKMRNMIT
jgi:hypothetical protein